MHCLAHTGCTCEAWQWAQKGLVIIWEIMGQCAKQSKKQGSQTGVLFYAFAFIVLTEWKSSSVLFLTAVCPVFWPVWASNVISKVPDCNIIYPQIFQIESVVSEISPDMDKQTNKE